MRKIITSLALLLLSCNSLTEKIEKVSENDDIITLENFNNTGVTFNLQRTGLTRSFGILDEYDVESIMPDGTILNGIITIENLPMGQKLITLSRFDDGMLKEDFIGYYLINDRYIVLKVEAAELYYPGGVKFLDYVLIDGKIHQIDARKPGEKYWDCVKREYYEMKKAYENRMLDDIACDLLPEGACKVLTMIAAAYECGK